MKRYEASPEERYVHRWYVRWIRPYIRREIDQQRLKLIWDLWGYVPLLTLRQLPFLARLTLIARFLVVDWHVVHGHKPYEIAIICRTLANCRARPNEIFLEAGCWNGGSSAKFSIICHMLGYKLWIYDSFEGVEPMTPEEKTGGYDFSGEYAAPIDVLRENLARYGEISICSIHPGWFKDTLNHVPSSVRVAYIDCDLAKGTREALQGIVPVLADDGYIFSQDFHILPVQRLLADSATWECFGKGMPEITRVGYFLASIRFGSATQLAIEKATKSQ